MMKYNRTFTRILICIALILIFVNCNNELLLASYKFDGRPVVILAVDKMDSLELFNCNLPAVKRFLATGACGLMNIRSGAGYNNAESGFLTLGSGSRGIVPEMSGGAFTLTQELNGVAADSYLYWTFGNTAMTNVSHPEPLIVPGVGRIKTEAAAGDHFVDPGRLGTILHTNGWRTCLIGNWDNTIETNRPGGLLLMDRQGVIDEGNINDALMERDLNFPYQYRFSAPKAMREIQTRLAEKKVIMVQFSDFFRLDYYQDQMLPDHFLKVKQETWINFDHFLGEILKLQTSNKFSLMLISPSVSRESVKRRNILAPVVISAAQYQKGILESGTTKWPGLVANLDFLSTIVKMAGIQTSLQSSGKVISVNPVTGHIKKLVDLNQRLITSNANQRRILDWYMALISVCWIGGLLLAYFGKNLLGERLITGVMVIPLTLIILPLFPLVFRQLPGFLGLTFVLTIVFLQLKPIDKRILILSGSIWSALILDQLFGWHLIRFSPLGYSAMAGSRYYGLGNEFMGVFLALSLILAYLVHKEFLKWSPPLILGISILVLSLPQLGAKFGGLLVGSAGFSFYLIKFYNLKLNNKKLWLGLFLFILVLTIIGWWDSSRAPELQTHIGQFIRLLVTKDYGQVGQIILRKLAMNLKLTVYSSWMRIILLALTLGMANRLIAKQKLVKQEDNLLWHSLLVTGAAAYLFNDSGILALATCLAYGFSAILLKMINSYPAADRFHDPKIEA